MKAQTVWQFLKPSWAKLSLFVIFIGIIMGGMIQSWAYSDVTPKPPLYDLLRPFPIWSVWVFLILPLAMFILPLRMVGIDIMIGPIWLFMMANFIYFYLLSCLMVAGFGWVRRLRMS